MRLPIVGGRLRGRWWLSSSPGKTLRVLGGTYEREQTRAFEDTLRPGDTVLDVGAHAGYYTLLSSVLVGDSGQVWAFEPNPRNFECLRRNLELNGRRNARAVRAAVSDRNGTARFDAARGSGTGRLAGAGELEVETVCLDAFCAEHRLRPAAVKVDVEGAELDVLKGGEALFRETRPAVFLSTHGEERHRASLAWLRDAGYDVRPIDGADLDGATEVLAVPRAG